MKKIVAYLCLISFLFTFAFSSCGTSNQTERSTDNLSSANPADAGLNNKDGQNADPTTLSALSAANAEEYEGEAELIENYVQ
ncbi:MAG: hypothetical protein PHG06_18600, partial [Parabacteroides sp.]|nr:hypothetical protein [Parabacteroides sp.]